MEGLQTLCWSGLKIFLCPFSYPDLFIWHFTDVVLEIVSVVLGHAKRLWCWWCCCCWWWWWWWWCWFGVASCCGLDGRVANSWWLTQSVETSSWNVAADWSTISTTLGVMTSRRVRWRHWQGARWTRLFVLRMVLDEYTDVGRRLVGRWLHLANDGRRLASRGVDPYGTGGTRPPIFGLGDIITNVPLNISSVISATFYPCNIFLISWKSF